MVTATRLCEIGEITSSCRGGVSRVSAVVDGHPVWFESADVRLRPSPEAFASSFVVPALHHGLPMRIRAPLSPQWRANVDQLLGVLHKWWGYPLTLDLTGQRESAAAEKHPDSGQCFSCGTDSFYSLLRGGHATRYLVSVHGFDISYRDTYRMRKFRESLTAVCEAVGRTSIVLRTNLRKHPLFASVPWNNSQGGALAAIGHVLSDVIGRLVIPSSFTYDDPHPCGSHWSTDPLWSSPSLEIIHDDATLYRLEKLKLIDHEPLVRQHLRICWENLAVSGNCSRCDKCVRTMIVLFLRGQLQHFPVFQQRKPLHEIVDTMDPVPEDVYRRWEDLIREGLPANLEAAARRVLQRRPRTPLGRVRHAIGKMKLAVARAYG